MLQVTEIGRDDTERQFVAKVLAGEYGDPKEILAIIRCDPQVCVMLLRVQKDEEKASKGLVYKS